MNERQSQNEDRAPDGETGRNTESTSTEAQEQIARRISESPSEDLNPSRLGDTDEDEHRFDAG